MKRSVADLFAGFDRRNPNGWRQPQAEGQSPAREVARVIVVSSCSHRLIWWPHLSQWFYLLLNFMQGRIKFGRIVSNGCGV